LVLQAAAFTEAQAISAVEDTACLPTRWTTEPCAQPAEPRRGETELNEQRAKLALIIKFHEQHAARLGDNPEFVHPIGCFPRFDTIAQAAAQLRAAQLCNVYRFDGRLIHIVATQLPASSELREVNLKQPPILSRRGSAAARSIANMTTAEVPDIDTDPDYGLADVETQLLRHDAQALNR
jgi:hypothetical protein